MTDELAGLTVWVTRPSLRTDGTTQLLRQLGASVSQVPFVRIVRLAEAPDAQSLRAVERIVLSSPTAAECFVQAIEQFDAGPVRALPCHVVGEATGTALRAAGFGDVRVAPAAQGEALAQAVLQAASRRERMLLPGSRIRRPQLPQALRAAGHEVLLWDLYDTLAVDALPAAAAAELAAGERPLLLLYSPSAAQAAVQLIPDPKLRRALPCAVLGPSTEESARAAGLSVAVAPTSISEAELLRELEVWWASR